MELVALRERIEYLTRRIDELEHDFLDNPDVPSLGLQIRSYTRHRNELEEEWARLAASRGYRVCAYHIHTKDDARPSVRAVSEMLSAFQKSFTTVYDGTKTGPDKLRATTTKAIRDATSFEFGFTSPGSLMVMLTIHNKQLSLWTDNSDIDDTISTICKITQANNPDELLSYAQSVGTPAVHSVYKWIEAHAKHDFGVHVMWQSSSVDQWSNIQLHRPDVIHLRDMIENAVKTTVENLNVRCFLQGWDIQRKLFRIHLENAIQSKFDVAGRIADALDTSDGVVVPAFYEASLTRTLREELATEKVEEKFVLRGLRLLQESFPSGSIAKALQSKQMQSEGALLTAGAKVESVAAIQ